MLLTCHMLYENDSYAVTCSLLLSVFNRTCQGESASATLCTTNSSSRDFNHRYLRLNSKKQYQGKFFRINRIANLAHRLALQRYQCGFDRILNLDYSYLDKLGLTWIYRLVLMRRKHHLMQEENRCGFFVRPARVPHNVNACGHDPSGRVGLFKVMKHEHKWFHKTAQSCDDAAAVQVPPAESCLIGMWIIRIPSEFQVQWKSPSDLSCVHLPEIAKFTQFKGFSLGLSFSNYV